MRGVDEAKTDREFAGEFFEETWKLLDLQDRTKEQIERMIHCSHASYYHLARVPDIGTKNRVKGYWQLSRVYAAAGQGAVARTYAYRCMDEASADGDPFLLTLACESLGRAAAVLGDGAERDKQAAQGALHAAEILDPDVKAFCLDNLKAMPRSLEPGLTLPVF